VNIEICPKRLAILEEQAHLLVTGGPGAGKTTIALLKAKALTAGLRPGQEILFLSFSRAAIRQVMLRCKSILSGSERKQIEIQTYHSFCLEILRTHGRLLTGKVATILFPDVERLARSEFAGDWDTESTRRAADDGVFSFNRFASAAADILSGCEAVGKLFGDKYPLIIVDEFQDTDDDQWHMVQALSKYAKIFCLADPDQSIFQYQDKVDPLRLDKAITFLKPKVVDLAGENHRSPNSGILAFADAVLKNTKLPDKAQGVSEVIYPPKQFASTVHAAVTWMFFNLRKDGIAEPSVAVLTRSNPMVADISNLLSRENQYGAKLLKPIDHVVLWDAELSLAAAAVLASILEWKGDVPTLALVRTLRSASAYYKLKNATKPSQAAADMVRKLSDAAAMLVEGKTLRIKAAKELQALVAAGVSYNGDPVADWKAAQKILARIDAFEEISRQVRLVRLFRATDLLGQGLADLWMRDSTYRSATVLIKRVLDQERLISFEQDPTGCLVMNIHKSKGKEFDGVVLVEGEWSAHFFDEAREQSPYLQSRRLLRVAITRAKSRVMIVRPKVCRPLVDP
jgi:DNA helicase-2/ATP-dependent DNA helicase PcrA